MAAEEEVAFSKIEALMRWRPGIIAYMLLEDGLGVVSAGILDSDYEYWHNMLYALADADPRDSRPVCVDGLDLRLFWSERATFAVLGDGPWTLSLALERGIPLDAVVDEAMRHLTAAVAAFERLLPVVSPDEGQ